MPHAARRMRHDDASPVSAAPPTVAPAVPQRLQVPTVALMNTSDSRAIVNWRTYAMRNVTPSIRLARGRPAMRV